MSSDSPEPMNVRPTLRQRRDELDAEIAHRETTQADAYNEQLEQLQSALLAFAEQHGGWTDSQRKNVASITVNGAVTVEFIPAEPEQPGHLNVHDHTGMHCRFDGTLPSTDGLPGLIAEQLAAPTLRTRCT